MPMAFLTVPKIRARLINDTDIDAVADLLARGFRSFNRQFWRRALTRLGERPTPAGLPQYGYLLEYNGARVGVILLIFSTSRSGDRLTTRCNLSSWYVEPAFRSYAPLLVSQALKRKNITYLNISAAPHTRPIVESLGFSRCSNGLFVAIPALHSRSSDGQARIFDSHLDSGVDCDSFERTVLLDHAEYGCISLWGVTSGRAYPFVFRPRLLKGFVPCAQLIYCRELGDFVRFARPIGRFLAMRGRPLVIINADGPIPGLVGKYLGEKMPAYFKGPDRPRWGDLAYTEAAMFGV